MGRPRVSILTFGCRANQYESDLMRGLLAPSADLVDDDADLWILNACTVTALAERKARQAARRAHREAPGSLVILIGCLADAVAKDLTRFPEADLLAGNAWKGYIVEVLERALRGERGMLPTIIPLDPATERSEGPAGRVRAFLRIQDGCARQCTYCRATQVRGEPRSKPLDAVREEARELVASGFPEIVLTGIDLAQYAPPEGDLAAAVRTALEVEALLRLRIASINVAGISDALIDALASDPRACPHFHIPLQSGDDGLLRRMARGYTIAEYIAAIERVRERLPEATFGSDVIVGFPGEDDAAFANTCRLIEEIGFVNLHTFRYSSRFGTAAASFDGAIPERTKRERAEHLLRHWHRSLRPLLDNRVGAPHHVLVEGRREGVWRGYTSDYIQVRFTSSEPIAIGTVRSVSVIRAKNEHLEGIDERRANPH